MQQALQRGKRFGAKITSTHSKITMGQQTRNMSLPIGQCGGFSDSPASGGVDAGQLTEDEIAEAIFDWWISGKPYKQWYADKYLQQKINFEQDENQQSI